MSLQKREEGVRHLKLQGQNAAVLTYSLFFSAFCLLVYLISKSIYKLSTLRKSPYETDVANKP